MPIIFQSTYSAVDSESLRAQMWSEAREDTTLGERTRTDPGYAFHTHLAVLTVPEFRGYLGLAEEPA